MARVRSTCALVLLWLVGACTSVFAEATATTPSSVIVQLEVKDLRAGEHYREGTRVRSPFMGLSFLVLKDWRASLPVGSVVFLDSTVTAGLGTTHLLTDVTRETVRTQLSESQSIEAGFVLHPVGSIQEEGQKLIGQ